MEPQHRYHLGYVTPCVTLLLYFMPQSSVLCCLVIDTMLIGNLTLDMQGMHSVLILFFLVCLLPALPLTHLHAFYPTPLLLSILLYSTFLCLGWILLPSTKGEK